MITLPQDVEDYVQAQLSGGHFPSRDALVTDAIRVHRLQREKLAHLRGEIHLGLEQLDQGLGLPLDIASIIRELDDELDESGQPRCRE